MNAISIGNRYTFSWKSVFVASLQISAFAALTAVCAQIRIPIPGTPVPITLQSLAVILSGAILGSRKGALSQIAMIAAGCAGFSVFSQIGPLLGPTGGYILGFVFAAFVAGLISESGLRLNFFKLVVLLFLASLLIFVPGVLWLKILTGRDLSQAVMMGFVPFIAGDILKTIVAAGFVRGLQKIK